jgi:uncharacterized protein (UPF0332 family)
MEQQRTSGLYFAKAMESLNGAEQEFAQRRFNNCANRAYYACFQAAIAALLSIGLGPSARNGQWRHDAVQSLFNEQLIRRRKWFTGSVGQTLERNATLRASADYRADPVSETQARRSLRRSREFREAVWSQRGGQE